ncbi:MAG: FAD-dependent oxidoreductase [Ignavibacteria bacterium]|nr:FAD-dependent oxidoreductase [Ignavibacteria bacterium]
MIKRIELILSPKEAVDDKFIEQLVRKNLSLKKSDVLHIVKDRSSIDARSRTPRINLLINAYVNEAPREIPSVKSSFKKVSTAKKVIIVGAGPAGYFAALELIENGIKPIIFDRGKDSRERRKDLRAIQQFSVVNPDSNYCFGEGGAGTYSDGKLYTRSHKRGDIDKAMRILVEHGANPDILVESHPHIGSNKLPGIIQNIRESIIEFGGEVHFESKVTDFIIENGIMKGVIVNDKDENTADAVILATGHSARDIFFLLQKKNVYLEAKPFAIGIRAEHPQALIDEIQYKQNPRDEYLPASSYKLVTQADGRGVFSFCMCPGGLIVPAATAPEEIVVNGMSLSRRDSPYANSGIVVALETDDYKNILSDIDKENPNELKNLKEEFRANNNLNELNDKFDGLILQSLIEKRFFNASGKETQQAPAQKITDFVKGIESSSLNETSYIPGIHSFNFENLLPEFFTTRLKSAFVDYGKKMKGYFSDEGMMVGIESRTSSPIKIPRNKNDYQHIQVRNLYPCGEGAGYAGGIISAALDGQNVAKAIAGKN